MSGGWPGVALLLALGCEQPLPSGGPPRVLAVDLLDAQVPQGARPARHRLYDGASVLAAPESGPDLALRLQLSAALSAASLLAAPGTGLPVRDSEGMPVSARSFRSEDPGEDAPPGAVQALRLVPDVRSGRAYVLGFDRSVLLGEDGQRLQVPPPLPFRTARRFAVLRADPPDGARLPSITEIRLGLSSPAHVRPSGDYGVTLESGRRLLDLAATLSANRRQLVVQPACPLPLGETRLVLPREGIEEDGTLAPLSAAWSQTVTVTEDPGPCPAGPDMGANDM